MLLAFKSAENLTAIPDRLSLNKDWKTDSDMEVKRDLWISLGVWNTTLLHPDLNFPFWGIFLLFNLCIIHECIYKTHFEPTFFPPDSTFILHNRLNPSVFNGCLDNKTADTKLIVPRSLMCFITNNTGTTQSTTRSREIPACSLQHPNCANENGTWWCRFV